MRIFLISAFFLLVTSCSLFEGTTTVEVINNFEYSKNDAIPEMNGTMWDVVVYYYRGDDIVDYFEIGDLPPVNGTSGVIEVDPAIEKARVGFKFYPDDSEAAELIGSFVVYTLAVHYLEKNEHNEIIIDWNTRIKQDLVKINQYK